MENSLESFSKNFLDKLEHLKCPICLDIVENVRELPCRHIFCFICLETYKKNKDTFVCPLCKKQVSKRKVLSHDAALESLCSFVRTLSNDVKEHHQIDVKTFFRSVSKESTSNISETVHDSDEIIPQSSDEYFEPSTSKNISTKRQLKLRNTNDSKASLKHVKQDIQKPSTVENKKKSKLKIGLPRKQNKTKLPVTNDSFIDKKPNIVIPNKLIEYQFPVDKNKILQWLHDTRNRFDRFSQTQNYLTDNDVSPDIDMPSVSQICVNKNKKVEKFRKTEEKKLSSSKDLEERKTRSVINSPEAKKRSLRRHSLECTSPMKVKQYQNLQERSFIENKLIMNIIEDEILDAIDKNILDTHKTSKQGTENCNLKLKTTEEDKFLDQLDNEIFEKSAERENSKQISVDTIRTNKENKSKSSWKSIKKLKKTIGKAKVPKKLDISLQSTQRSTKKDIDTKLNKSDPSEINATRVENKTVDFQKMEDYFTKAIPKMIETNMEGIEIISRENSQHKSFEKNQEQIKDNDSDIYIVQTQPLSKELMNPKSDKISYAAKLSMKLEGVLHELIEEYKITNHELTSLCPSMKNIFKIFDKSFNSQTSPEFRTQKNFCEKQIQTDMLSLDGFNITSAAFKTLEHEDIGTQTDNYCPKCPHVCPESSQKNIAISSLSIKNNENLITEDKTSSNHPSIEMEQELVKIAPVQELAKDTDEKMCLTLNVGKTFIEDQMSVDKILDMCKTQKDVFSGETEVDVSKNSLNTSRINENISSSNKENSYNLLNIKTGAEVSQGSGIICSVPQINSRVNRKLMFDKAMQERKELEQNLKRVRSVDSESDSEEERPHKVKCNRFLQNNLSIEFESESLHDVSQSLRDIDVVMKEVPESATVKNGVVSNNKHELSLRKTQGMGQTQADTLLNYCDELIEKANKQILHENILPERNSMDLSQILSVDDIKTKNIDRFNQSLLQKTIKSQPKIGTQDLLKHYDELIEKAGKQIDKENNKDPVTKSQIYYSQIPTSSKPVVILEEDEEVVEKKNTVKTQDLLDHCNSLIAKTTKALDRNDMNESHNDIKGSDVRMENDDDFFCENLDQLDEVLEKEKNLLRHSKNKFSESLFETCKENTINKTLGSGNKTEEEKLTCTPKGRKLVKTHDKIKKNKTASNTNKADGFNSSDDEIFSDVDVVDTTPQKSITFLERLSCSQMVNQNSRASLKFQEDIENLPMTMNIVPPPPGFDDDFQTEETEEPESVLDPPSTERESENVIPNSLSPQKFQVPLRRPLCAANANSKKFETPQEMPTLSQQFMKVSPICKEKSRDLNVIEMVRQSKFSPLTIVPKSVTPSVLTSTPKQKSILSYVKPRIRSSQEPSTSKMEKPKPSIAFTRLNNAETACVLSLCSKNLATRKDKFGPDVTHMIVSVDKHNYVKDHTIKFISAIAAGIWVLNIRWVQECLSQNAIIDEEPYEVLDITGIPSPKISRLTRLSNPLLRGLKFYMPRSFRQTSLGDVTNIIQLLQGEVVSDIEELSDRNEHIPIIISELVDTEDYTQYEEWASSLKVLTVDINWLSLSVSRYKLLSLRPHLLCSDDFINELGYPSNLIEDVAPSLTQDVTTYN